MEHSEFRNYWNKGKLEIDVDRSKALQIANSKMIPKRYQMAHLFWSWVWILSILAAFAVMYFYSWWAGLLILALVTPALFSFTKRLAMQFIIDYSVENKEFYQFAVTESVIRIRQKIKEGNQS